MQVTVTINCYGKLYEKIMKINKEDFEWMETKYCNKIVILILSEKNAAVLPKPE